MREGETIEQARERLEAQRAKEIQEAKDNGSANFAGAEYNLLANEHEEGISVAAFDDLPPERLYPARRVLDAVVRDGSYFAGFYHDPVEFRALFDLYRIPGLRLVARAAMGCLFVEEQPSRINLQSITGPTGFTLSPDLSLDVN